MTFNHLVLTISVLFWGLAFASGFLYLTLDHNLRTAPIRWVAGRLTIAFALASAGLMLSVVLG